jgi:hypothetical protein
LNRAVRFGFEWTTDPVVGPSTRKQRETRKNSLWKRAEIRRARIIGPGLDHGAFGC